MCDSDGISLYKYFRIWVVLILKNTLTSEPSSKFQKFNAKFVVNFEWGVRLIAPVIAKAVLS